MSPIRPSIAPAFAAVLLVTGCGQEATAPRQPTEAPERQNLDTLPDRGQTSMLPGRGATSFVGRWAKDVSWCAAPQGERRPIEITSTRFTGYENACEIAAVEEIADGYVATLACVSEGAARSERVRFQVTEDVMRLTYLDRTGDAITLRKCTTLEDTATTPAVAP